MVKVTTLCPGNCKCCKNRLSEFKKIDTDKVFFQLENFEKVCKAIKNIGGTYIALSGGEPTIVPNLDEFISIAHSYGLTTRINTSGFNITEEKINKWLNSGLDQVVLSIYGTDYDTYTNSRGNETMYQKAFDALKILSKVKEKNNFILIIQTVIMKDNYKQMNDLLKLAIEYKADKFWPSYLEDAINLPDARLTKEDIDYFVSNIKPHMKQTILSNGLNKENIENIENIYLQYFEDYIYHKEKFKCRHLGKHLSFYPDGRIDLCCGYEYLDLPIRYIDYNNIEQILTTEFMSEFKNEQLDYCKYCPQGLHREINLNNINFNEYEGKDCLYEKDVQKLSLKI